MPTGTDIGVYPANRVAGTQVSSTYEGRHLTFRNDEITAVAAGCSKGTPVMVGENIVGVAFDTPVLASDLVAIDTEGVWNLPVTATEEGALASLVVAGDELFISKTTCIISKNFNKNTHTHFGYALGGVPAGDVAQVIAVKVHWDPDDAEEMVGQAAAVVASLQASKRFREYHYEAQGGGYPKGDYLALTISTARCTSAQALRRVLQWENDDTVGGLISGYAAVGEFDLIVTVGAGGAGSMKTTCVIFLTSHMELTGTNTNNFQASWLRIQEYGQKHEDQINNLFEINDTDGDYPYANNADRLFVDAGAVTSTQLMKFTVNGTKYWFLVRNAIT